MMRTARAFRLAVIAMEAWFAAAFLVSCNYPVTFFPTEATPPAGSVPSPDGSYYALIREGHRLVIADSYGDERQIASSEEIIDVSWFPDSEHILYGDRIAAQDGYPAAISRLWISSIASGESYPLETGSAPLISPDGHHVAFRHSGGYGDACVVDAGLGILELDDDLQLLSLTRQEEIRGIPLSEEFDSFYPALQRDREFPGIWRNETTLEVAMRWACKMDAPENGVYSINVESREALKLTGEPAGG